MEKIMSKTYDDSKLGRAPQVRELRDDELENVSGGSRDNNPFTLDVVVATPFSIDIGTSENLRAAFVEGWPTK
jgi:hypothetical protein